MQAVLAANQANTNDLVASLARHHHFLYGSYSGTGNTGSVRLGGTVLDKGQKKDDKDEEEGGETSALIMKIQHKGYLPPFQNVNSRSRSSCQDHAAKNKGNGVVDNGVVGNKQQSAYK